MVIKLEIMGNCVPINYGEILLSSDQRAKKGWYDMEERWMAFLVWAVVGLFFIAMGMYDMHSMKERPFGFWANAKTAPMEDVTGYNRALGRLWCVYGVLFIFLGLPLLQGQNSGTLIVTILGAMLISIGAMAVYVVGIEPKYRKK